MSQSVSLTFAAKAAPDAPRRFSGVAYSGGVIPHYGWMGDVAIDLDTLQNQQGDELPILVDHDQRIDAIAGKGRIFRATGPDGLPFLAVEGELPEPIEAGPKVAALFVSRAAIEPAICVMAACTAPAPNALRTMPISNCDAMCYLVRMDDDTPWIAAAFALPALIVLLAGGSWLAALGVGLLGAPLAAVFIGLLKGFGGR